jgi:hypothetical protein
MISLADDNVYLMEKSIRRKIVGREREREEKGKPMSKREGGERE